MNEFREAFRDVAKHYSELYPQRFCLAEDEDRDILNFIKSNDDGFDIQLECMDYGVYPSSDGWHTGCWDVAVIPPSNLRDVMVEFIESILQDAELVIHSSNGKPYRWIMRYQVEGERVEDETGLILFNWFGKRSVRTLSNFR